MKTKKYLLMAAMLLTSVCMFAQSNNNEPLKGDVNEDGKVDVADIVAIIEIIQNNGGTSGETTYYYYAGWTLPTESNVDTIITETYPPDSSSSTTNFAGKKTTSKSTMDYTTNNLYNSNEKTNYYVLVPPNHAIYDSLGNNIISNDITFTSQGTITVGNQTHTIYKSNNTSRGINAIIIR